MSSTSPSAQPPMPPAAQPGPPPHARGEASPDAPRRAFRSSDERLLGGVAAGVANHLGLRPLPVRVAFLVLVGVGGFGALLYAGLWMFLPAAPQRPPEAAPGLAAATRQGKRSNTLTRRLADQGPLVAVAAICIGIAALLSAITNRMHFVGPLLLAFGGVAVLWWQADEAQRQRWRDRTSRLGPFGGVAGEGSLSLARIVIGLAMLVVAIVLFTLRSGDFSSAMEVASAALLGVLGVGLIVGPALVRLSADLGHEREARVRSEERADVAAHLHDSVLQTLALIQKSAHDPATVARLARAQERDLRSWLYEPPPGETASLNAALRVAAAEAEDAHGVPVEVVAVGDCEVDDSLRPLLLATREAVFNAVRHSGAPRVDVYAECTASGCEVFVRDRGQGFDVDDVAADRHGIRGSIVERMERHGGTAEVISEPGSGTEVRLRMPLTDQT